MATDTKRESDAASWYGSTTPETKDGSVARGSSRAWPANGGSGLRAARERAATTDADDGADGDTARKVRAPLDVDAAARGWYGNTTPKEPTKLNPRAYKA